MAVRLAGGGVRTVQHLERRGVRQVFEVCPSRCLQVTPLTRNWPRKAKTHRIGGTCLYLESLCADRSQVVRYLAQKCPVQHYFEAFEPADTSRKGLRDREEVLEKSNTWPEQVLDTLNSCWRALLESCSNTQANVRSEAL